MVDIEKMIYDSFNYINIIKFFYVSHKKTKPKNSCNICNLKLHILQLFYHKSIYNVKKLHKKNWRQPIFPAR